MFENFKLSEHFTFFELTRTSIVELQKVNRVIAEDYIDNLKILASARLEMIRSFFNRPMAITSGFRCEKLNERVGGSKTSQHMIGDAADFYIVTMEIKDVFEVIMKRLSNFRWGQLIYYPEHGFIHISNIGAGKNKNQVLIYDDGEYKLLQSGSFK